MSAASAAGIEGPPAGAWGGPRLGRRLGANLLRVLPLRVLRRLFPRRVLGLCYHVVSDRSLPHVRQLYRYKDPTQFEADLLYLKRNFRLLSHEELRRGEGGSDAAVLTFDDGLAECFTVVRPLLLRHGVPCVFFLSPPHLDNRRMFPFDRASLALDALGEKEGREAREALAGAGELFGRSFADVPDLARWLTRWMRTLRPEEEALLDRLCALAGVDVERYLAERRPYLTTEQALALAADGFTLGAHGLRHVALGAFSAAEVRREIVESCARVAELTGAERVPFAFPYDADAVDRDLLESIRAESPVDLFFDSGPVGPDRPFLVNRLIADVPALVGERRSNLAGYLRSLYLDEVVLRARGGAARRAADRAAGPSLARR